MKKHVLDDLLDLNCRVFGLVSIQPFYQMAWDIKRVLNLELRRADDLEWKTKNEVCYAPVYRYEDTGLDTTFELIRNHASSGKLAPELKTVDAFLVETNYAGKFSITLEQLKQSKFVQYCFTIDVPTIKTESQNRLKLN